MKKNYDFKINPKKLTAEQIAKHKDFDALLHKAQVRQIEKNPVIRRLGWLAGAVAASLIGVVLFTQIGGQNGSYQNRSAAFFQSKPFIDHPLEHVKPTFAKFIVDPSAGGVYEYPTGSKLIVPAAAFVRENGEQVSGEVTLHYREMHDFVDFFVAGIPMTYDSAGITYNLESAGMIEIYAEQDGKRIKMAPNKTIDVELISNVATPAAMTVPKGFNIYKLDTSKRNWIYQDIDRMQPLSDASTATDALDAGSPFYPAQKVLSEKLQKVSVDEATMLAKIESSVPKIKEPSKPQRASNSDHVFNLDLKDLFPANKKNDGLAESELRQLYRQYEKMLWQLSPNASITPDELQREFSAVDGLSIKKLSDREYELSLQKGTKSIEVKVVPVLLGSDYDKALNEFNTSFATYQKEIAKREEILAGKKAALTKEMEAKRQLARLEFEEQIAELRKKGLDYAASEKTIKQKVVNRFAASEFGIWNCDRPLPPEILEYAVNFRDENGKVFENRTAYLVDKNRNTVYQFLAEDGAVIRFNKNSENLLWLVTEDNKLAVFRPVDFKELPTNHVEAHDLVLETVDKKINSEQDIREVLLL